MSEVKVMRVIVTTLLCRGEGTSKNPIRRITQYWDMEGNLLVESDPNNTTEVTIAWGAFEEKK